MPATTGGVSFCWPRNRRRRRTSALTTARPSEVRTRRPSLRSSATSTSPSATPIRLANSAGRRTARLLPHPRHRKSCSRAFRCHRCTRHTPCLGRLCSPLRGGFRSRGPTPARQRLFPAGDDKPQPARLENSVETVKFRISPCGQRTGQCHAVQACLPCDLRKTASCLGDIAQCQQERRLIALGEGRVQVFRRQPRIPQVL